MKLTLQYIQKQFGLFNAAYFDMELPEPRFEIVNTRTKLGQFRCKRRRKWFGRGYLATDCAICMSRFYEMSERDYQNVLLHEMIHYYIAHHGVADTAPHGRTFIRMMNRLNAEYGWDISVRADTRQLKAAGENRSGARIVLALATHDGQRYFSVVHPNYRSRIDSLISKSPTVTACEWFVTTNDYFSSFTKSRSLRGRRTGRKEFERVMAELKAERRKHSAAETSGQ